MKLSAVAISLACFQAASAFAPVRRAPFRSTRIAAATLETETASVIGDISSKVSAEDVVRQLNESGVQEQACLDAAAKIQSVPVSIGEEGETADVTYIHWPAATKSKLPPLLLVHGFDSSALEYRRLGPKLAAMGIDTYAVDVLGWGFTQLQNVPNFSAQTKIRALQGFVDAKLGQSASFCVAGASLGGAAAIELAVASPQCCGLILIDAQGFTDGVGPMASLPSPLAKMGVAVLKSVPLRNSANQMSYFDKDTFATEEAQVIGRIHCLREGWSDAMVSFMQSGGFTPSLKVPQVDSPTLVLWGRQDTILDGKEFASKFIEAIPDSTLQWIEDCGHVPHLEQPEITAASISEFMQSKVAAGTVQVSGIDTGSGPNYLVGSGFFLALGASLAAKMLDGGM